MKLSTLKDILLPVGAIFTLCPILLAGMIWIMDTFGPESIFYVMIGIGAEALLALMLIRIYEKRKAAIDRARLALSEGTPLTDRQRRLLGIDGEGHNP